MDILQYKQFVMKNPNFQTAMSDGLLSRSWSRISELFPFGKTLCDKNLMINGIINTI